MSSMGLLLAALGLGIALGAVVLVLVQELRRGPLQQGRALAVPAGARSRRFVFRNGYLLDHSAGAEFLLPSPIDRLRAWDDLTGALGAIVPDAAAAMRTLREDGRAFRLEGRFGRDAIQLVGARDGGDLIVTVAATEAGAGPAQHALDGLRGMEAEVALLTEIADSSPVLSWVLDNEDRVIWGNGAYQALAEALSGKAGIQAWPLPALFPLDGTESHRPRRHVVDPDGNSHWYAIAPPVEAADGTRHLHATLIDATIAAEQSLSTFIQTLTKTFAHLPTGLAIFDRSGALVMFNPALIDMTGLDPQWLSRRPQLADVFDALRERRRLPEPRDYKAWRERLRDPTRVDAKGSYVETWTLPSGQTFQVTGRPQHDGTITLMLEDTTALRGRAARQRAEQEALAAALDFDDHPVFVFAADGTAIATNANARAAPLDEPETLDAAIETWSALYGPSPVWAELQGAARGAGVKHGATPWIRALEGPDGHRADIHILPVLSGGVAVRLRTDMQDGPKPDPTRAETRLAAE